MRPDLQQRLDAVEAFEGKPNPELRRMFELMSSVPRQPSALREAYRRRRNELRGRFPNQWVLYRLSMDYETCTSVLEVAGAYPTAHEAVAAENALPPEQRRFTIEYVEPVNEDVVRISTPFLAGPADEPTAPRPVGG